MTGTYNTVFVVLSVIVATLASFAALDLAGRTRSESGAARLGWIGGGAIVMGLGIWSMHFVGMLAFHLPTPILYDVSLMLLSVVVAIAASLLALVVINRPRLTVKSLVPGGVLMGGAIAGMHYIGMASMRGEMHLSYRWPVVVLSVVIAIVASLAALWLAFTFRSDVTARGTLLKILSAVVMGFAISGMHYTAMAAARFAPHPHPLRPGPYIVASGDLGRLIVVSAIVMIVLALIGAVIDRSMQAQAAVATRLGERAVELGKSERQYRLLFDSNPNPMWVHDAVTGAFLAVNEAAIAAYGYDRQQFLAMTLGHLQVPVGDRSGASAASSSDEAGAGNVAETVHRKKSGDQMNVAVSSQSILFDGHNAFLTLAIDVTDRTRAEEALRQSEQRTRLILDTALDAVVAMDGGGRISDWNTQAERMFGWSRAEAIGRRMADTIIPPGFREAHEKGLARFLHTGEGPVLNKRIEIVALNRDGTEFPVELAISPAKLGSEWTFSAFIRDLTEQKKAAAALRAGEQRYRDLFEHIPIGLYSSTPDGRLIDANPEMAAMLGYPSREALLAIPATELYVDPEDRLRWKAQMNERGFVRDFDARLRRADGAVIWGRDTTRAGRDASGEVVLYEGVLKDITDRVETERRLQASEAQLRQALKMEAVGQLAGGIAHDFNNLLTVIMSYGSMLVDRIPPGDSNREDVQEIMAAADRAAGLTRQLLAFSRKQVMQPRVMSINTVVVNLESMLSRLIGEDIELQTSLDPGVATINADPGQLEQVLMNLVVNARDAMPGGGRLTISTSNSRLCAESAAGALGAADGEYVVLAVSDTGIGMTRDVQQRLFDPFFTTKEQGRGTGLGLSTVYGIVKQSGGEICVYSEPGLGTAFKVYFPRFAGAVEERPGLQAAEVPRGTETLLLVEDDANLRALAVRVLRDCGYEVLAAPGGREALAIAADPRTLIQAVVTDVVMPEMSGRELVERLVAARPGMSFLMMSGYTDDDVVRRGVLQGDTAFLQKPFTPAQLARKVRQVLDGALREKVDLEG
ncbi:MAG TPA: PAS domain S-box protein [Gemmatimonadaceae bacterium]|nr:PAS domain S-box protein [Gemmatimonadaceae bacterium]